MARDWAFVVNGLGNIASPVSMLVASVLLARSLSVTERGQSAAIVAPFLLLIVVAGFGLPDSVIYYVSSRRHKSGRLLLKASAITVFAGLLATGALGLLSGPLSGGDETIRSGINAVNVLIVPMLLLTILRSVAAGNDRWTAIAVEKIVGGGARIAALVYLSTAGLLTPLSAAWSIAGGSLVGVVVYLSGRAFTPNSSDPEYSSTRAVSVTELISFSGRVWLGSVAGVLLMRLDQLLVVPLSNAYQLGLYVVAVNCAEVLLVVINTVREVVFARTASKIDVAASVGLARKLTGCMLALSVVYVSTLTLWFNAVFGQDYRDAMLICALMAVSVWVGVPGSIAGAIIAGSGNPGKRSLSLVFAFVVNALFVVSLVPVFGAWGAAFATLAGNLVSGSLNIIFATQKFPIKFRDFYLTRGSTVKSQGGGSYYSGKAH